MEFKYNRFFYYCNKNKKCLRQIAHITCNYFLYFDIWCYVNIIVIKRLISKSSNYFGQYNITIIDWIALNHNISRIPKITLTWLVIANIYYKSFSKFIKSTLYFEEYETLVITNPPSAKVVKMLATSSIVNGFFGHSFQFVKCPSCFKVI